MINYTLHIKLFSVLYHLKVYFVTFKFYMEMKIFMNYIDEIFRRADIQCISMFLLYGTDGKMDPGNYEERIDMS